MVAGGSRDDLFGKRSGVVLCQTLPVPVGSAMDSPQAKAEPISDLGGASVKRYLRKGRKYWIERKREHKECKTTGGTPRSVEQEELHGKAGMPSKGAAAKG